MNEINSIRSFLQSVQVHFSNEWLESCILWCKSEALSPNYTLSELQAKVFEQWRFLDLRDLEIPILPPNLGSKQLFTLTGSYSLQMMQVVDISKPKLWQLQKIRNSYPLGKAMQNDSDLVGTAKRLLQVTLTDGVQEVEAMEYRPIACLSLNLQPGVKIRIEGPITIRRGRLMLEEKNVKILGGDVEDLLIKNATENVLARFLKLNENPNPRQIEEKMLSVEKEEALPQLVHRNELVVEMPTEKPKIANQIVKPQVVLSLDDGNDDIFNQIDFDLDDEPQVFTISQLKGRTRGEFRIKAIFKEVVEKLTMDEEGFHLVLRIADSSGELQVKVKSEVIQKIAQTSIPELLILREQVTAGNEEAKQKVINVSEELAMNLIVANFDFKELRWRRLEFVYQSKCVPLTLKIIERIRERTLSLNNIVLVQLDSQLPLMIQIF